MQFLFLCQNWRFLALKIQNAFEFLRLNWSKIVISWFNLGNFVIFGPKNSNFWYILESKIEIVWRKVHFFSKNYKFLKSLKNGQFWFCAKNEFLAVKIEIFEFLRLNWSKIVISWFYLDNLKWKLRWFLALKVLIFDTF